MENNHHVLVVHGTWNPPGNPPEWHELPDDNSQNCCTKLASSKCGMTWDDLHANPS